MEQQQIVSAEDVLGSQNQSWFSEEVEMENETSFIAWNDALKAMREFSELKNKRLIDALDEINNPIKYMQIRAEQQGASLNGVMAVSIANDPNHLKSIAERALKTYDK
jgi:hypothetical protein